MLAKLHGLYSAQRYEHSGDLPQQEVVFKISKDDEAL
jgi:hypothetical protein